MSSLLLQALSCQKVERPPVWLMRQAGRYLPEYQDLRKKHSLSTLFHDPELASAVTWMPLKRFDLDAAIVFSDLLVIAEVWGKQVLYPEAQAPLITPCIEKKEELFIPTQEELKEKLSYVFATIELLKGKLPVPLIGFCGAPFTLLCYLLEGNGREGFPTVRRWIDTKKEDFKALLEIVCETCILFARLQIQSGVEAFQVFDSWANLLSKEEFTIFVLPYWKRMKEALAPFNVPVLFFSRCNTLYPDLISSIQPSGISFDEGLSLQKIRQIVPEGIAIQGNFSPQFLLNASSHEVAEAAFSMADSVRGKKGIILNLGHGVLPKTPLENVEAFLKAVRL